MKFSFFLGVLFVRTSPFLLMRLKKPKDGRLKYVRPNKAFPLCPSGALHIHTHQKAGLIFQIPICKNFSEDLLVKISYEENLFMRKFKHNGFCLATPRVHVCPGPNRIQL